MAPKFVSLPVGKDREGNDLRGPYGRSSPSKRCRKPFDIREKSPLGLQIHKSVDRRVFW